MEMLVVVAIIVALAGLGGYYVMGAMQSSQVKTAKLKAVNLAKAADNYKLDHNMAPPPSLTVLLQADNFGGPYLTDQNALMDPWGQQYQYDPTGSHHNGMEVDVYTTNPKTGQMVGNF
jgi:type II secretory pathway pseudopilin PulG